MLLEEFQIPSPESANTSQQPPPTNRIPLLRFQGLSGETRLGHAVFTRNGGTSAPPFHALNVSYSTADSPKNVTRNLR
ncbi:MAG: laccase domain-containing protein, partial [Deltaproteobacteria bacterium]|nr:laccase domain-containing protein [Deltaproteobacteria bacterium]